MYLSAWVSRYQSEAGIHWQQGLYGQLAQLEVQINIAQDQGDHLLVQELRSQMDALRQQLQDLSGTGNQGFGDTGTSRQGFGDSGQGRQGLGDTGQGRQGFGVTGSGRQGFGDSGPGATAQPGQTGRPATSGPQPSRVFGPGSGERQPSQTLRPGPSGPHLSQTLRPGPSGPAPAEPTQQPGRAASTAGQVGLAHCWGPGFCPYFIVASSMHVQPKQGQPLQQAQMVVQKPLHLIAWLHDPVPDIPYTSSQ